MSNSYNIKFVLGLIDNKKIDWPALSSAIEHFVLSNNAEKIIFWLVKSVIEFRAGNFSSSLNYATNVVELHPDNREALVICFAIYSLVGDVVQSSYYKKNILVSALHDNEVVSNFCLHNIDYNPDLLCAEKTLLQSAHEYTANNKIIEAEHLFREILYIDRRNKEACASLVAVLVAGLRFYDAQNVLRSFLISTDKENKVEIMNYMLFMLFQCGKFAEAEALYLFMQNGYGFSLNRSLLFLLNIYSYQNYNYIDVIINDIMKNNDLISFTDFKPKTNKIVYLIDNSNNNLSSSMADIISGHDKKYDIVICALGAITQDNNVSLQGYGKEWLDVTALSEHQAIDLIMNQNPNAVVAIGSECLFNLKFALLLSKLASIKIAWNVFPYLPQNQSINMLVNHYQYEHYDDKNNNADMHFIDSNINIIAKYNEDDKITDKIITKEEFCLALPILFKELTPYNVSLLAYILSVFDNMKILLTDRLNSSDSSLLFIMELFGNFGIAQRIKWFETDTWDELFYNADVVFVPPLSENLDRITKALWLGLPVVSFNGKEPNMRCAGNLMHNLGLGNLVVEEYEDLVKVFSDLYKWSDQDYKKFRKDIRSKIKKGYDWRECIDKIEKIIATQAEG